MTEPTSPTASTPSPNGREANGRFAKGNPGGTGNPFARKVAALRQRLLETVTEQDIKEIAYLLLLEAKGGDKAAIKLLFQYVIGKPQPAVNPDTLDLDELMLLQAASLPSEAVNAFTGKIPPQLALVILCALLPQLTQQLAGAVAATVPPAEGVPPSAAPDPSPPTPEAQPDRHAKHRPSPNRDNGPSAPASAQSLSDRSDEPPSLNGDNGSPLLLERLLRLFPPAADPNT